MSSASDPLDQAFPDSTAPQAFSGDPIDKAFPDRPAATTSAPAAAASQGSRGSWGQAVLDVGDVGLTLASGTAKSVGSAVNDLLPEWGAPGSRAAETKRLNADPLFNYQPQTAWGQQAIGELGTLTKPIGEGLHAAHEAIAGVTSPRTADVIGDVATLLPFKGTREIPGAVADAASQIPGVRTLMPGANSAIQESHPLTAVAKQEQAALDAHAQAASDAGVETREVTPANRYFNNLANKNLQNPTNAPVTHGMIDAAEEAKSSPAYRAVDNTPAYDLGPQYQSAIKSIDMQQIDPKFRPPLGGQMSGAEADNLSKNLRDRARGFYDDASNNARYNTDERVAFKDKADNYYAAAKTVEAAFREGSGDTQLADSWDAARRFHAQAEAWRSTIDNAGNVNPTKIRRVLGDESSPEMQQAAANADRLQTRASTQSPGLIKRVVGAGLPVAGAALGNMIAPGHFGAAGGAALGELAAEKLTSPRR
jgi:hypothetical protein